MASPHGEYTVEAFRCDCLDAVTRDGGNYELPDGRYVCKHVLVVSMARPCDHCGKTMILLPHSVYFECPNCGNARDARIVKAERRDAQESHSAPIPADRPRAQAPFRWDREAAEAAAEDTAAQASLMAYAG